MKKFIKKLSSIYAAFADWFTIEKLIFILLGILGGLALIALFVLICKKITGFIIANYELLIFCSCIVGSIVYYVWCKRENQKSTQGAQIRTQMSIEEEREKQHLEDAYIKIQQLLYLVINDTSIVTRIPQLKSISALEAPTHFVLANGFYVFQYLVAKDISTTSNIMQIKEILNNRTRQALNSGEVMGSQTMYFSNSGKPYQKVLIHDIKDNGSFLQINAVIVGEKYANYIERAKLVSSITPTDNSDLDF